MLGSLGLTGGGIDVVAEFGAPIKEPRRFILARSFLGILGRSVSHFGFGGCNFGTRSTTAVCTSLCDRRRRALEQTESAQSQFPARSDITLAMR